MCRAEERSWKRAQRHLHTRFRQAQQALATGNEAVAFARGLSLHAEGRHGFAHLRAFLDDDAVEGGADVGIFERFGGHGTARIRRRLAMTGRSRRAAAAARRRFP